MNCKPGDLARVIDHPAPRMQGLVDCIVKVTTSYRSGGWDMWRIAEPRICGCGCGGLVAGIADALLRPIRDPGDDAKDEMLRPLPATEKDRLAPVVRKITEAA